MKRWIGPAAWSKREARAGDRLPYASHLDAQTLVLRDGSAMQVLRVAGLPFETEDSGQLDHMLGVREVLLRSVLDARFVLYHHVVRRRVQVGMGGDYADPFCALLDARRRERLAQVPLFVNEQFLTIVRRPARGKAGLFERLSRRMARGGEIDPRAVRELEAASAALLASLTACFDDVCAALAHACRQADGLDAEALDREQGAEFELAWAKAELAAAMALMNAGGLSGLQQELAGAFMAEAIPRVVSRLQSVCLDLGHDDAALRALSSSPALLAVSST